MCLYCDLGMVYLFRTQVAQWVRQLDYLTTHTSLSPIWHGFAPGFKNYKKGCTRLAAASVKVYQLLAHGQWFSLSNPASSTTKTGCHDIAEILLKVALKHQKSKFYLFNSHVENPFIHLIYSLRGEVKAHKTSLTCHFFLKCLYQARSCISFLVVTILPLFQQFF
jgi:hypothetical protein